MKTHVSIQWWKKAVLAVVLPLAITLMALPAAMAQELALGSSFKEIGETSDSNLKLKDELKAIYKATKRFQDVNVALKEGYMRDPMNSCEDGPTMGQPAHVGAMGIHYFRPDLLGITETSPKVNGTGTYTDFRKPAILIYEPQADGSMELVAIENLVFATSWHKENGDKLPEFMGYQYFNMTDNPRTKVDEAHMFQPHYDLHIWLFRENPNGLFTPFNPNVTCKYHQPDTPMDKKMDTGDSHKMKKSD